MSSVRYNVRMTTTISATAARKQFYKLLRRASKPGARITITLEGADPVVLMAKEEVESWIETLEVLSDPQLVKDIAAAKRSNDFISWEDMKKELGWD